jgi:hypothetical protein
MKEKIFITLPPGGNLMKLIFLRHSRRGKRSVCPYQAFSEPTLYGSTCNVLLLGMLKPYSQILGWVGKDCKANTLGYFFPFVNAEIFFLCFDSCIQYNESS